MRFCVSIPCFYGKLDLCEAIRKVKAAGFDAGEIWGWKGQDLAKAKAALQENNMELIDMCTTEFRMTDPLFHGAWLYGLRESCEAAKSLGVRKLISQVGPDTGAERAYQHAAILGALKQALPILREYDITLLIEPLNTYVDHGGYYLTSSAEGAEIIRETGDPHVKMLFDIYHQQIMEGNLIPNITAHLDTIGHLHCAGHPGRHEPWMGEISYRNVFVAAEKAGFDGWCGLEYMPILDPDESLRKCREYLSEVSSQK